MRWEFKFFLGMLAFTVTNTWKAYNFTMLKRGMLGFSLSCFTKKLAESLLRNPFDSTLQTMRRGMLA